MVAFASVGTTVVTLLVLPAFDVAFDALLGRDLRAPDVARTAYAAALAGTCVSACAGVVGKIAQDRNLGVFQEVHLRRRVPVAYWVGSALLPAALAVSTGSVLLLGVWLSVPRWQGAGTLQLVGSLLTAVVVGALLGVFAAAISVGLSDPYLGANLVNALLPLGVGVIVPTALYPTGLAELVQLVPLSHTLGALTGTGGLRAFAVDVLLALVLAAAGLSAVRLAVARLRNGTRLESI
ncbi:ABC transporter [Buchananella hordeovulneris]|uniref:ABC transporter n=1 Tax=Buchananella hordeovulneris TaxID=52770 RepID=UPI000F5F59F8|nr:ABC transporter [Buchananella hordeovulneris]RRD52751.1 ABC transporter [Buchananella hordeovulneris]